MRADESPTLNRPEIYRRLAEADYHWPPSVTANLSIPQMIAFYWRPRSMSQGEIEEVANAVRARKGLPPLKPAKKPAKKKGAADSQ